MAGYVDLYILPIRKKNMASYRRMANQFGKIIRSLGATEYREFVGDDLEVKGMIPLPKKVKLERGEVMTFALAGFQSKAHRNQVNKRVMEDPRVKKMCDLCSSLFDCKRLVYGGFQTFIKT